MDEGHFEINVTKSGKYVLRMEERYEFLLDSNPIFNKSAKVITARNNFVQPGNLFTAGSMTIDRQDGQTIYKLRSDDRILSDDQFVFTIDDDEQLRFGRSSILQPVAIPTIFKAKKRNDDDERIVAAAVLIPGVADYHGSIYSGEVSRNAAYYFMENYLTDNNHGINIQHKDKLIEHAMKVIQSYVTDRKMTFKVDVEKTTEEHLSRERTKVTYPKDTWLMWARILNDSIWEKILNGRFTGWSPEGLGKSIKVITAA